MSLQTLANKYIQMLPKAPDGTRVPMPKFVAVNQLMSHWNGIAIWEGNKTCTIKIQKRIMKDEKTLDRIIAHEMCHAWAYWMVSTGQAPAGSHRGHLSTGMWHKAAQIVNQREGQDFVTEFSDETYVEQNEKKFWVYLERNERGTYWAWFSRVTDALERHLRYRISSADMHNYQISIFKTDDSRFLLPAAKLPQTACLRETPEDMELKLDRILQLYPVTQDSPRDIKTLVGQAKMAKLTSRPSNE